MDQLIVTIGVIHPACPGLGPVEFQIDRSKQIARRIGCLPTAWRPLTAWSPYVVAQLRVVAEEKTHAAGA